MMHLQTENPVADANTDAILDAGTVPVSWTETLSRPMTTVDEMQSVVIQLSAKLEDHPNFHQIYKKSQDFKPSEMRLWGWELLAELGSMKVGLMTVDADNPIGLHDHPGSSGAQLVLAGEVRVVQYQHSPVSPLSPLSLVSKSGSKRCNLERVSESLLSKADSAAFTPDFGNIHELVSTQQQTIILNLVLNPYNEADRNWYFPITEGEEGKNIIARCMNFTSRPLTTGNRQSAN